MRTLLIAVMAIGALALSTPFASAKHGWSKQHGGWQHGKVHKHERYAFNGRGHHYGWYIGRGNPHRYW
jgi:hypothetical protein